MGVTTVVTLFRRREFGSHNAVSTAGNFSRRSPGAPGVNSRLGRSAASTTRDWPATGSGPGLLLLIC